MEKSTRVALEERFPDQKVKQRKGSFGKTVRYVDGGAVVARLNDCFDSEWSFKIVAFEALASGEILVHGRLEVAGLVKEAFGRGVPAVSRDSGEVLSTVDAYKAAATDALKKCATLLGVAAYLYSDDPTEEQNQPRFDPRKANRVRASAKQISAIWTIGRRIGLDAEAIRRRCLDSHGVLPEHLEKPAASQFISELDVEARAAGAA